MPTPEQSKAPQIVPLTARHDVSGFDCGVETLNSWLKTSARNNQESGVSKTYVVCDGAERVVAYYCMSASEIEKPDTTAPASMVLIGRLAIDRSFKQAPSESGQKLTGRMLLQDAFSKVTDAADRGLECAGIVVDALPSAIGFYDKCNFKGLDNQRVLPPERPELAPDSETVPMFIPMSAIRAAVLKQDFAASKQDMTEPTDSDPPSIRMGLIPRNNLPIKEMRRNTPRNVPFLFYVPDVGTPTADQARSHMHQKLSAMRTMTAIGFCGVAVLAGPQEETVNLYREAGFKPHVSDSKAPWVLPAKEMDRALAALGLASAPAQSDQRGKRAPTLARPSR